MLTEDAAPGFSFTHMDTSLEPNGHDRTMVEVRTYECKASPQMAGSRDPISGDVSQPPQQHSSYFMSSHLRAPKFV